MGLMGTLILLARAAHARDEDRLSMFSPLLLFVASLSAAGIAAYGSSHWPYAFLILIVGAWADRRRPVTPAAENVA
jgi:hypothetical protein